MRAFLAFLSALLLYIAPGYAQVPKSFITSICGTPTSTFAAVCVNDGNGQNLQWAGIFPSQHLFSLLGYASFAANNTALQTLPVQTNYVWRQGYSVVGDAPLTLYVGSLSPCSLNSGAGDGGSQVPSSSGGCWIAQLQETPADVRIWGAKFDGITDDGPAITRCLAVKSSCLLPASQAGALVSTTVVVPPGKMLVGATYIGLDNPPPDFLFPGQSFLRCQVTICVRVGLDDGLNLKTARVSSFILTRTGTPPAGSKGLVIDGGYNITLDYIGVFNQDTCIEFIGKGTSGIAASAPHVDVALCQSHHFVFDGWPEARFTNGRAGANGGGNYSALDFVFQKKTNAGGSGSGPNTITFDNYHFNPGTNGVSCAFRWGEYTVPGGVQTETRLTNVHVEYHGYSGTPEGIFCSDSTVPVVSELFVSNMLTATGGITVPLFNFNAVTALKNVHLLNNVFGCSSFTLAPTPVSGPAFDHVYLTNNFSCEPTSFTSNGVGNNVLLMAHNTLGGTLTLAGNWSRLSSFNDFIGALNDTATGHVAFANPVKQAWTPDLRFGGSSAGITYSSRGGILQRNAEGGFTASFLVTLSSKGSATGAAQLFGLPLSCAAIFGAHPLDTAVNFASLTGQPVARVNSNIVPLVQNSSSGNVPITDANFTNTTSFTGVVNCGHAQ